MRRASAPVLAALLVACGGGATAPLGQLETPVAVAVHQGSNQVFIANLGSDELKVFDPTARGGDGSFVFGPAVLFPLSIPTVSSPAALADGDRFVFVLSRDGAEVGFVELDVEGALGPRSVDGPDGFPVTQPLPFLPTALAGFAPRWALAGATRDVALVAGLAGAVDGALALVRPPVGGASPALVGRLDLPGIFPADLALDPSGAELGLLGPDGPIDDCRALAIADARWDLAAGHEPGIWLSRIRVTPEGAVGVEPLDGPLAQKIVVRVPVTLEGGIVELRAAPVRSAAFVPAPLDASALAALAADPCALRSGRLVAVLDPVFCADAVEPCADVAVVDLPTGELVADVLEGPAAYGLAGAGLAARVLPGPFTWTQASVFDPSAPAGADGLQPPISSLPVLGMVTSTDGAVHFLAPGLGPYLRGPGPAARAPAGDPAFLLDGSPRAGGQVGNLVRTDALRLTVVTAPTLDFEGAMPRDEIWTGSYLAPLPGLEDVGTLGALVRGNGTATLTLPAALDVTFLDPIEVRADPAGGPLADRLVPQGVAAEGCAGLPILEVSEDGRRVTVALVEQEAGCDEAGLPLSVLPPAAEPWVLIGSVTGFAGRLPSEGALVLGGDTLLFRFDRPPMQDEPPIPAGATWRWETTDGFTPFGVFPETTYQFPAGIDAWLEAPPSAAAGADWRVYVTYAGGDALLEFDPERPLLRNLRVFQ